MPETEQETDPGTGASTDVRKGLLLEIAAVMTVLYLPVLAAECLHTLSPFTRSFTTEALVYRIIAEASRIVLVLYVVLAARRFQAIKGLNFDLKRDIPIGALLFCLARVVWMLIASFGSGRSIPLLPTIRWESSMGTLALLAVTLAIAAFYEELLMRWYLISRLE